MRPFVTPAPHCEPPIGPGHPVPRPQAHHRLDLHAPRRTPHGSVTGRHPTAPRPRPATLDPDCRRFTEIALRAVLEVLDRRRQPTALAALVDPTQLDLVTALARAGAPGRTLGTAALRRVHIRHVGPHSAEVFGSYARGPRTFAIAARVDRVAPEPDPRSGAPRRRTASARHGWLMTSLRVG